MLKIDSLYTEYKNELGQPVKAAQDISFEVPEGHFFTLLGPSGCGKTTTLRSIAGLERPSAGTITVGGTVVYSAARNVFVPPNHRGFGMVFQSYAIWPHMDVYTNTAFPLQVGKRKYGKDEIEAKVMRVLKAVQLDHLRDREATKLSGGQQQRLALARALVMEPKLLLLDEPLSNLDAKLREAMRFELKRLQRELRITTIYVTHDQSEALAMSHQIAVMNAGRIQQMGTPREIYERPQNQFVADFVGTTNFVDATIVSRDGEDGHYVADSEIGRLRCFSVDAVSPGQKVILSIRPEDVRLSQEPIAAGPNVIEGVVDQKVFLGESLDWRVLVGNRIMLSRTHPTIYTKIGETAWARLDPAKCVAMPAAGELKRAA